MPSIRRILRARLRILGRWIVDHAFVLFVLGPILVGGVIWAAERQLVALRPPLAALLERSAAPSAGALGWSLAILVLVVLWSGTLREVYGRSRPGEDLLDVLPVGEGSRFVAIVSSILFRTLVPVAVLVGSLWLLEEGSPSAAELGRRVGLVGLAVIALALLDLALVYVLAALRCLSFGRLSALGGVAIGVLAWAPLDGLVAPLVEAVGAPAALLEEATRRALELSAVIDLGAVMQSAWIQSLACLVIAGLVSLRRRRRDLEHVQLEIRSRPGGLLSRWLRHPLPAFFETRLAKRWDTTLTAGLRRDLRMVARRFSPLVQLAVATALVAQGLAILAVIDGAVPAAWRAEVLVVGGVLSVLSFSAIVPFLLAHQLPRFWIERSTGIEAHEVWATKAVLAVLLALLPMALALVPMIWLLSFGEAWRAGLQLFAAGGSVAAIVGASVFEIAEEPHLGLLFATFVGLAVASLFVLYPAAWFLWLGGAGWAVAKMVERGARRVRFTEVPR